MSQPAGATHVRAIAKKVPACMRTGACCENVLMRQCPKRLRELYEASVAGRSQTSEPEVETVALMLEGRCRGKILHEGGAVEYVYGPCLHLGTDERGLPCCEIRDVRPKLCRVYPYNSSELGAYKGPENPGYMRGCGFNADPAVGIRREEIDACLIPLDDSEK